MIRRLLKFVITFYHKIRFFGKCRICATTDIILRGCDFEGANSISDGTYLSHTSLGYGTYIGMGSEFSNCKIGRFCSVGNYVRVVSAAHPLEMVSTYPAFYSSSYRVSYVRESKFREHLLTEDGYECIIGNDVWIGDNVLIKGGVRIGNGSVIGMGSIVNKDVPPYAIVAGVPARIIRNRFDESIIDRLLANPWWEMDLNWLKGKADSFSDVNEYLRTSEDDLN